MLYLQINADVTNSQNSAVESSGKTAVVHTQLVAQLPEELDLDKGEKVYI